MLKAGVLGHPIAHSLSPAIHGHWLHTTGVDGAYGAQDVPPEHFGAVIERLADEGYRGVNVTAPLKAPAAAIADQRSDAVDELGAANLLVFEKGLIRAANTDVEGFLAPLIRDEAYAERLGGGRFCVLGAGGAAAAVLYALRAHQNEPIVVVNRTPARIEALKSVNSAIVPHDSGPTAAAFDVVIDARSAASLEPATADYLRCAASGALFYDLKYYRPDSDFVALANALEQPCLDGLPMLIAQARPSFAAFFGVTPPADSAPLEALLKKRLAP